MTGKLHKSPGPSLDFQTHLAQLEANGLLVRIDRPVNKDTELHPLFRCQFLGGVPENERRAFLFTNVIDSQGRRYGTTGTPEQFFVQWKVASLKIGSLPGQPLGKLARELVRRRAGAACAGGLRLVRFGIRRRAIARHGPSISLTGIFVRHELRRNKGTP